MGLGAVVHTLNPRLFAADLEYLINHGAWRIGYISHALQEQAQPSQLLGCRQGCCMHACWDWRLYSSTLPVVMLPRLTWLCMLRAAEDCVLMLDVCFAELAAQLRPKLTSVKAFVVLTDRGSMHRAVICHPHFRRPHAIPR